MNDFVMKLLTSVSALVLVSGAIVVLTIVFSIRARRRAKRSKAGEFAEDVARNDIQFAWVSCFFLIMLLGCENITLNSNRAFRAELNEKAKTYSIILNYEEVQPDEIDFTTFEYTEIRVDDENQVIYVSNIDDVMT